MSMVKENKITKFHLAFFAFFLFMIVLVQLLQYRVPSVVVLLKGEQLEIMVAKSVWQKQRGLGKRASLGKFDGMLFIFNEPSRLGVVMREMKFPIDVVWFREGKVVDIAPALSLAPDVPERELPVYYPRTEADIFLELSSGWAREHNLKLGDELLLVE